MSTATLVCWHCGEKKEVEISTPPQFGFEVANLAMQAGMAAYVEHRRSRVLIFCNPEHAMAETTATGAFRLRAKGPAKEPS